MVLAIYMKMMHNEYKDSNNIPVPENCENYFLIFWAEINAVMFIMVLLCMNSISWCNACLRLNNLRVLENIEKTHAGA